MSRDPNVRAAAVLAAEHPFGLLRDGDAVIGCFFAFDARRTGAEGVEVAVLRRLGMGTAATLVTVVGGPPSAEALDAAVRRRAPDAPAARRGTDAGRSVTFPSLVGRLVDALSQAAAPHQRWTRDPRADFAATLRRRFPAVTDAFARKAAEAHMTRAAACLRRFADTLDPEAVALLEGRRLHRCLGSAWEGVDATFGLGAPLKGPLAARPHLARLFVSLWRDDPERFASDVARLGADGILSRWLRTVRRLPPRLAASFDRAEAVVHLLGDEGGRAVAEAPWSRTTVEDPVVPDAARLLDFARVLPANWLPDGPWDGLAAAVPVLWRCWSLAGDDGFADLVRFRGDWTGWVARLRAATGNDLRPVAAMRDMDDVAEAFGRQAVGPALLAHGLVDEDGRERWDARSVQHRLAWAALFGGRSLLACLDASRRWHVAATTMDAALRRLPRAEGEDPGPVPDGDWGAGLPDRARDGLGLVVLRTEAELADEGRPGSDGAGVSGLDHCVGGYVDRCLSGRSRIASVRRLLPRGTFVRVSTAELRLHGDRVEVAQHRARGNATPEGRAATFLDDYVRDLNAGRLAVDADGWAPVPWRGTRRTLPYDPDVPGNVDAALDLWAPLLPGHLRGIGAAGWAALALDVVDMARTHPWRRTPLAAPDAPLPGSRGPG